MRIDNDTNIPTRLLALLTAWTIKETNTPSQPPKDDSNPHREDIARARNGRMYSDASVFKAKHQVYPNIQNPPQHFNGRNNPHPHMAKLIESFTPKNLVRLWHIPAIAFVPATHHGGDHVKATYLSDYSPRKVGSPERPGNITVWLGTQKDTLTHEDIYEIIINLGGMFALFGGTPIPEGPLGIHRQAVGAKWSEQGPALLAEWQKLSGGRQKEIDKNRIIKIKQNIDKWKRIRIDAEIREKEWNKKLERLRKKQEEII